MTSYRARAEKLFINKKNDLGYKELCKALNIIQTADRDQYLSLFTDFGYTSSELDKDLSYYSNKSKYSLNLSKSFALRGFIKESKLLLNIAKEIIVKVDMDFIRLVNKSQKELGLVANYSKKDTLSHIYADDLLDLYLKLEEYINALLIIEYKNSQSFFNIIDGDYSRLDNITGICYVYKTEIDSVAKIIKSGNHNIFDKIYNCFKKNDQLFIYIKVLMLLEKLKTLFFMNNISNENNLVNQIIELIREMPNSGVKLNIYEKVSESFLQCEYEDEGIIVINELHDNLMNIWCKGENYKKFFNTIVNALLKTYSVNFSYINKEKGQKILTYVENIIEENGSHDQVNEIINFLVTTRNYDYLNIFLEKKNIRKV